VVFNNDLPAEEQGEVEDEDEDSDDEGDDEEEEGGEKGEEEGGEYAMQEGEDGESDDGEGDDDDGEGDDEEEEETTNPWANKAKGATIEEIEAEVEEEEDDGDEFGTEGRGHASRWKEVIFLLQALSKCFHLLLLYPSNVTSPHNRAHFDALGPRSEGCVDI
jgi:hypothetical protein